MIAELKTSTDTVAAALGKHLDLWAAFQKQYEVNNALLNPISDDLVHLWELTRSLEARVKQIQASVGRAMNLSPGIVPISKLPSDIMSRIFQMTIGMESCTRSGFEHFNKRPICPDVLLTVCSHWRQIALSSCSLWSHIDLFQKSPLHEWRWVKRARLFADRARRTSLELHIHDSEEESEDPEDPPALLTEFCVAIAPRVKSLDYTYPNYYANLSLAPLHSLLAHCDPQIFVRLELSSNSMSESDRFFGATSSTEHAPSQVINLPRLEEVLLQVKFLRLSCLYPYWTSQAYHGLIELRLDRNYGVISIPEANLVAILSSSPDLEIFGFELQIENELPPCALVNRVHLPSLELLDLSRMAWYQSNSLIRWLAPGAGPLRVSLRAPIAARKFLFEDIMLGFYARSTITHLSLGGHGQGSSLHLCDLLPLMPHLRKLDLFRFTLEPNADPPEYISRLPHLDTLRATRCEIYTNELRRVVELHPIRELHICSGRINTRARGSKTDCWVSTSDYMTERDENLAGIAPFVKFIILP